ncbi:DUF1905 domain-containing protein [Isoptericola sp. b441]|uniref:DUF1905 domain-containing protein n=1 Tax=Actinotalea lenta TaxID=3064654 RepID=A0ABT9D816_9CELL|nr:MULTISPECIES: DUF1905 domain-containing protein [unclassified Isoptericola]MDO8107010.1 DUF1905 domain-containing protein [Isoptericola sp. b441]MDO8121280.1 DUF1905 domain-containing protein [Isoptericola sp. b490]
MDYEFEAVLYEWEARRADSWVFVNLPEQLADEVLDAGAHVTRGFGSLRVEVRIGTTVWRTSIFPSQGAGTFVLPLKKAVRRAQGLTVGDTATVHLRLVDA